MRNSVPDLEIKHWRIRFKRSPLRRGVTEVVKVGLSLSPFFNSSRIGVLVGKASQRRSGLGLGLGTSPYHACSRQTVAGTMSKRQWRWGLEWIFLLPITLKCTMVKGFRVKLVSV